jgi:hypothetical protein
MGGKGSGKKPGPTGARTQTVTVRMSEIEAMWLDSLILGDELRSQTVRRLIREAFNNAQELHTLQ